MHGSSSGSGSVYRCIVVSLYRFLVVTVINPPKLPCLNWSYQKNMVEWFNSTLINLVVTYTADCICHQLTNSRKKLKFAAEPRNSKQIYVSLEITNAAGLGRLNALFRSWEKKYRYVVICASDRIYNHQIFKKKSKHDERTSRYGARIRCYNP